jgi:hypothetical protein
VFVIAVGFPSASYAQQIPARSPLNPPQVGQIGYPDSPASAPSPASSSVGTPIPSFSQLFRSVGSDFRHLPSTENALLLTIGGALTGLSHRADESFSTTGSVSPHMSAGAIAGNSYVHLGAAFALYAAGRATENTRMGRFGADMARAQILTQVTTYAVKYAADRTRPNGDPRSFPSGHTATMFATATVVKEHFGWKAAIPAYAAAAYVGASRVQDNKHYLSDVMFGATLGIVAGRTVTVGTRGMKFAVTPVSGPEGGVGIGLTRVK